MEWDWKGLTQTITVSRGEVHPELLTLLEQHPEGLEHPAVKAWIAKRILEAARKRRDDE